MKPLVISRDSWHWKLTSRFTMVKFEENLNLCYYTRCLLISILGALAVTFLSMCVIGLYFFSLYSTIAHGLTNQSVPFIMFTSAILIFMTMIGLANYKEKRKRDAYYAILKGTYPPTKEPSFLVKAYRAWKEKTCVRISVQ